MIKVLLFGAAGRMGRLVSVELEDQEDISLMAGVEAPGHPAVGTIVNSLQIISDGNELPGADVWVDFSYATPALEHIRRASGLGKPILVGATGFSGEDNREIEQLAACCPVLIAPNLSTGIGVMNLLTGEAAKLLGKDFDPVIFELHHSGKRDAPSGTALRLAQQVDTGEKSPQIAALRAGGAVGEHQVRFVGSDEELIIIHRAFSRKAFSRGVPRAVRFIAAQEPGLYGIRDMFSAG